MSQNNIIFELSELLDPSIYNNISPVRAEDGISYFSFRGMSSDEIISAQKNKHVGGGAADDEISLFDSNDNLLAKIIGHKNNFIVMSPDNLLQSFRSNNNKFKFFLRNYHTASVFLNGNKNFNWKMINNLHVIETPFGEFVINEAESLRAFSRARELFIPFIRINSMMTFHNANAIHGEVLFDNPNLKTNNYSNGQLCDSAFDVDYSALPLFNTGGDSHFCIER